MRILGAKEMLKIEEPKLVYEFWTSTKDCRDLLKNPTSQEILSIIRYNISAYDDIEDIFNVWVGDNSCQVCPLKYENGELELTDINVVGDASPYDTLWFVFDKLEWELLDKHFNIELSKILNNIWHDCESYAKIKHNNDWPVKILEEDYYNSYKDIIEANIKIDISI